MNTIDKKLKQFEFMLTHSNLAKNPHQYEGVKFCITNELTSVLGIKGGFIVDEMGLGKTITMIGTIFANYIGNTLIVLPPILLNQWHTEIFRTTGHKALIYHGQNKKKITAEQLKSAPITLTTYSLIKQNKKSEHDNLLHQIQWARIVFDEAHHLRNRTKTFKSSLLLKTNIKWLITGTPIQNRITDMYNLCKVLGLTTQILSDLANHEIILSKLILRRTKKQVGIQISDLNISNEIIQWAHQEEKIVAKEIHSQLFPAIQKTKEDVIVEFTPKPSNESSKLVMFLRAKQLCILPSLMFNSLSKFIHDNNLLLSQTFMDNFKQSSSKLDRVIQLLTERKDNGNGKLIFCHYREEINTIKTRLEAAGIKKVVSLDGRNNNFSKQEILKSTQEGTILILQIQTACEGLNLQKYYSEIYFITPHWNPSVEDQAIARCHRIGQTKPVYVFRFEMDELEDQKQANIKTSSLDKYVNSVHDKKRKISINYLHE